MPKLTGTVIREAHELIDALRDLQVVRKRLAAKPKPPYERIALEMSAADIQDGEGQGTEAWVILPSIAAAAAVDAAERVIKGRLNELKVRP